MSSFPVATLTLPQPTRSGEKPLSPVFVTFYSRPGNTETTLDFTGPEPTNTGILTENTWSPFYATYYWDPPNAQIKWGLTNTGLAFKADGTGTVIPQDAASTSAPAEATTPVTSPTTSAVSSQEISQGPSQQSTQQTASPSSVPTAIPATKKGLEAGPVAGVAIGCLILGALIAGLLVWFCLGRKRRQAPVRDHEASAVALIHREKGASAQVASVASVSPISQSMENGLPQPLEDKAISGEISKISSSIKNHVQSFYHSGRVSPGLLDIDDLQGLGDNLPMSTGTLSTLLGNSDTREIALRFCIAWVVISRVQLSALPSTTLLPPEIAECFLSMAIVDRGSRAQELYLSKWRVITAELMQSAYVRNPFSAVDPRSHNIKAAMDALEGVLQPYADSRVDNKQRQRNLEEILKRAAIFAFTMFSQPNSWKFDWQDEESFKSGSLCVFPALVQVTDENGDPVQPPRPFSEAVIRRLDE